MFAAFRRHLSYANLLSTLCLFLLLGGGAYAALKVPAGSIGSKQIRDGQVRSRDIASNAVNGANVADGSLAASDFGSLPSGEAGPTGPQGPAGPEGPAGPAGSPDTPAQVLEKVKAVDGSGSNIDADTLDGRDATDFQQAGATAGGDLRGSYPNPSIAPSAVESDKVADGSLRLADLATWSRTGGVQGTVPSQDCLYFNFGDVPWQPYDLIIGRAEKPMPRGTSAHAYIERSGSRVLLTGGVCNHTSSSQTLPGPEAFFITFEGIR